MTIHDVELSWSRSGGYGESQNGTSHFAGFTEGWQITHSADATDIEILSANGLPVLRQCHDTANIAVSRIHLPNRIGPIFSIVIVEYSGEIGPNGLLDTPINKIPEYVWSDTVYTELIDQDLDGEPIVTKNGEPINGVTMEVADQTLTVTRNFAFINPWAIHQYRHSVNSDTFAGYPPGTARLVGYTASSVVSSCLTYWRVQGKIQFRYPYRTTAEKAWYARVRHEGYKVRVNETQSGHVVGTKVVNAIDEYQAPSNRPVLLTEEGFLERDPLKAHYLHFKRYRPLPYSVLGLL